MKPIRGLLYLIMGMAILFASALPVKAIDFEAEKVYESVFIIYSGNSMGSGFSVGENCIVTNAHVIDNVNRISVVTYGGEKYEATVLGLQEKEDIAVLLVDNGKFPILPIGELSTVKTGDDIYAIGAPKGMAYTLTKGSVSAKERLIGSSSYIQIDAPINEGNSGGPLLNDKGEVLGMNTLKMSDSEGIGLAIPMTRVCEYLRSLGIELTDGGNVANSIEIPEAMYPAVPEDIYQQETQPGEENRGSAYEKNSSKGHSLLMIVTVISLAANVIFAVLLISEKKKKADIVYDPCERTDFEIDIWE